MGLYTIQQCVLIVELLYEYWRSVKNVYRKLIFAVDIIVNLKVLFTELLKHFGSVQNKVEKYGPSGRSREHISIWFLKVAEDHEMSVSRCSQQGLVKPQHGVFYE